jgi:hypothetical protein
MSLLDTASLIVTPNGYKEGKLYSVIPSDGSGDLSVTRATTATRVNSAGLVELVPYNLFQYSQDFTNGIYTPNNITATANQTTAPDGTLTADKLTEDTSNSIHRIVQSATGTGTYTISYYVKANGRTRVAIFTPPTDVGFNLLTDEVVNIGYGTSGASIENVGNDWHRISLTFSASGSASCYIGLMNNSNQVTYTGDGTSGVYAWGAQLVEGSTAKDYQKTETRLNIPRLDYSNGTCPSLLVEPQRTNLATYSQQLDQWSAARLTITANDAISPDGTQNAEKLECNLTTTGGSYIGRATGTQATGYYTISTFAKKGNNGFVAVLLYDAGGTNFGGALANLNDSTIALISTGNYSNQSCTIENVGNGWFRISYTCNKTNGSYLLNAELYGAASSGDFLNATAGQYNYLWGAQVEAGAYGTSYIPTTSASVTRNADIISKTGISSLIGQTEGTIFCEVLQMGGNTIVPFQLSDTTNSNRAQIEISGVGAPLCVVSSGGVNTAVITGSYLPFNQYHKIAVTYKANEFKLYVNGALVGTDTSGAVPTSLTAVYIGSESGTTYAGFEMKSAVHWKQVLTNDQLIALTTI